MAKKQSKRKASKATHKRPPEKSQASTAEQLHNEAPKPASTPTTSTPEAPATQTPPTVDLTTTRGLILRDTADLVGREKTTYGLVIGKAADGPSEADRITTRMVRGLVPRRRLRDSVKREAEHREAARVERFNTACERARQHFARPEVKDYWLDQMGPVVSAGRTYALAAGPLEWPDDKAKVYAVMAICAQEGSAFNIISRAMRESEWFKANSCIWNEVQNQDIAADLMRYIEADLRKSGFLDDAGQQKNPPDGDGNPQKVAKGLHVDLATIRAGGSRKLLRALLEDEARTGVAMINSRGDNKYGVEQPQTLKKILRAKAKHASMAHLGQIAKEIVCVGGKPHYFKLNIPLADISYDLLKK
jgi:hypothetical protein